ncbi:MAG: hypothetical protein Q4B54_11375, partial [Coriobacteriales bacterium]|nr:hypothetical protein [Coriobacteriales bacterium]
MVEISAKDVYALFWEDGLGASVGESIEVSVHGDASAGLARDTELTLNEYGSRSDEHSAYVEQAAAALGVDPYYVEFAKVVEISLVDGSTGEELEPASSVNVRVSLLNQSLPEGADVRVVHFAEQPEVLEASVEGSTLEFSTTGFSTYAIVAVSSSQTADVEVDVPYYLSCSNTGTQYAMAEILNNGLHHSTSLTNAGSFYFQSADSGKYYIYVKNSAGEKQYLAFSSSDGYVSLLSVSADPNDSCAIRLEKNSGNSFYIAWSASSGTYRLNKSGGYGGGVKCFRGWTGKDAGSIIVLTKVSEAQDALGLDGKSYVIVHNDTHAMSTNTVSFGLGYTTVSKNSSTGSYEDTDADTSSTLWSFTANSDGTYYISTIVDGGVKYLSINSSKNLILTDTPHSFTVDAKSSSGYIRLYGETDKWLLVFDNNRFVGNDGTPGNNHRFTLGQPSAYIAYKTVVEVPTDDGADVQNVTLESRSVMYADGMQVASPSENPYSYFPTEGS